MRDILQEIQENPEVARNVTVAVSGSSLLKFAQELADKLNEGKRPPARPEPETLLTIEDTAKFLNVTRATLWQWSRKGILIPLKIGNLTRYRKSDILAAMERRKG